MIVGDINNKINTEYNESLESRTAKYIQSFYIRGLLDGSIVIEKVDSS